MFDPEATKPVLTACVDVIGWPGTLATLYTKAKEDDEKEIAAMLHIMQDIVTKQQAEDPTKN